MGTEVKIGVYEAVGGGFLVRVSTNSQAVRYPTDTQEEATLLAESIKNGIEAGIPLEALMPEEPCVPVEGI